MTIYDFNQYDNDVVEYFRENYPDWDNVKKQDLQICCNGTLFVGNTEFKTPIKLSDYEI